MYEWRQIAVEMAVLRRVAQWANKVGAVLLDAVCPFAGKIALDA